MSQRRRQLREMEVLEVLIVFQKAIIPCFRCRVAFTEDDVRTGNIENEHLHEHALGGSDEPPNRRFSHKRGCHDTVTNGTPATSAGSSKNRIAKATHRNRTEKFVVNKPPLQPSLWRCTLCGANGEEDGAHHDCPAKKNAPPARCRRCGEYEDACTCKPKEGRKSKWPVSTLSS